MNRLTEEGPTENGQYGGLTSSPVNTGLTSSPVRMSPSLYHPSPVTNQISITVLDFPHLYSALNGMKGVIRNIEAMLVQPRATAKDHSAMQAVQSQMRDYKDSAVTELKEIDKAHRKELQLEIQMAIKEYKDKFDMLQKKVATVRMDDQMNLSLAEADKEDVLEGQVSMVTMEQKGDKAQDATQKALDRMKGYALDAEEVAKVTDVKMGEQIEQMERTGKNFEKVDDNTKRGAVQLKYFARRWLKSKCIRVLFITDVLLLTAIILCYCFWEEPS